MAKTIKPLFYISQIEMNILMINDAINGAIFLNKPVLAAQVKVKIKANAKKLLP